MSQLSIRVETIGLFASPTTSSGQIGTPNRQSNADRGSDPLDVPQAAAAIGDPVPIVFCRRIGNAGGVLISPKATEARFSNDANNDVTANYHLILSEGELDLIQVRDVFQQSCRVGTFTQAYDRRAGNWGPGNVIVPRTGFEDQVPDAPIFCGTATGSYAGVSTGSFTVTIPHPFRQWDRQVHVFVRNGISVERLLQAGTAGPSNNVADLVLFLLRRSTRVPDALIDFDSMRDAARFVNTNGFGCDIEINEPSNLADWLTQNLGYFLLRESRRGGKKGLRPLLPTYLDGRISLDPVPWAFTFTEDHILPGSLQINYSSRVERQPFCVQMIWRQQPDDALGLARTTEVRFANSAPDGPFEQHDISAYCTTENHALKVGAYILSRRRHIDHRLVFSVRSDAFNARLSPGDVVRVRLRRIPSVGEPQAHDYLYEVDRIGRGVTGEIQLELTHYPVNENGVSVVALDVSAATGNGILLPTGRAAVNCDLNDSTNTSFTTDLGPWEGWDINIPDIPIYFGSEDFTQDAGDGWGFGIEPFEDDSLDLEDWGDIGELNAGLGPIGGFDGEGNEQATVSFGQPVLTYPDVWYLILQENFARVRVDVSVNAPPVGSNLALRVSNGTEERTVIIAIGKTSAPLVMNANGTSLFNNTTRTLSIVDAVGGSYDELVTTATAQYQVAAYPTQLQILQPGIWVYSVDDIAWRYEGATVSDFEWDEEAQEWNWTGTDADWNWDPAVERWLYIGSATGWSWLDITQRWWRTTSADAADPKPEGPPSSPPPLPDSLPTVPLSYSVTARVTTAEVPTDRVSTLAVTLDDEVAPGAVGGGVVTIPGVSMYFGQWRWNPATGQWDYPNAPADWIWTGSAWVFLGRVPEGWEWTMEDGWGWTAGGAPVGPTPTSSPPVAGPSQSIYPPDAERWIWNSRRWVGDAYVVGGVAPLFDSLQISKLTYHRER
jgi:hypothetical protein